MKAHSAFLLTFSACSILELSNARAAGTITKSPPSKVVVADAQKALAKLNHYPIDRQDFIKAVALHDNGGAVALLRKYGFSIATGDTLGFHTTAPITEGREHKCGQIVAGGKGPKGGSVIIKVVPCPS